MTSTTTQSGTSRGEEGQMASTTSSIESEVREFAREFPTPNVERAVALCEAGTLAWTQVHELFKASLATGLAEVAE